MADGRGRENLPRPYTTLVTSWQVGATKLRIEWKEN